MFYINKDLLLKIRIKLFTTPHAAHLVHITDTALNPHWTRV